MRLSRYTKLAVLGALAFLVSHGAQANVVFSGSSGTLAASVDFGLSGTTLTVTLSNTSSADTLVPQDVLMAVFFDAQGLTPVSASLNGSTVVYGSLVQNVGEGWVYQSGLSGGAPKLAGISASGLSPVFSNTGFFFSPPVTPLDGTNYGLVSAGDNSATGNTGVTGHGPLFKSSVAFTLTTPNGFTLDDVGTSVVFQYGTSLTEPSFCAGPGCGTTGGGNTDVPEPMSIALLGAGLAGLGVAKRRRRG